MTKILAPVGGKEQLLAAVRCGADAVYLGAKGFNARRNAQNFDELSLSEAVGCCHEHGVLVYVTLNTLIMDSELDDLKAEIDNVLNSGADAVIVQDLAVAKLVHERCPDIELHASTQTAVHNLGGVLAVQRLGFSQVVLARELSLSEIRSIRQSTDMKLEVFVHGAHCMCVSGACYLSSVIGQRSGNRGLCAQPCRTDMRLNGRHYALSLKDMCLVPHIKELEAAGVSALKIEGRMKRPEYVAAAVTACKQALLGQKPDLDTLKAVFSRSGFTDGYYTGKRTYDMFGSRTLEDAAAANSVLGKLAALYEHETSNVPVNMRLTVKAGSPSKLDLDCGGDTVTVYGAEPQAAKSVALDLDFAKRGLSQMGGTAYYLDSLDGDIDEGLSLSISSLKQLRRDALVKLSELRRSSVTRRLSPIHTELPAKHITSERPTLRLRFSSARQAFDDDAAEKIILPFGEVIDCPELISRFGDKLIGELPALCFPIDADELHKGLARAFELGLREVLVNNIGFIEPARSLGYTVHGDYGMNITNGIAMQQYDDMGLCDAVVSFELPSAKIAALGGRLKRGVIGYGYLPLMVMRACPARGEHGCGGCEGINRIIDAKNESFTLLCHERKYCELLNGVPLYIADKGVDNVDFMVLRFSTESREQAKAILGMFRDRVVPDFRRTGGLYYRKLL